MNMGEPEQERSDRQRQHSDEASSSSAMHNMHRCTGGEQHNGDNCQHANIHYCDEDQYDDREAAAHFYTTRTTTRAASRQGQSYDDAESNVEIEEDHVAIVEELQHGAPIMDVSENHGNDDNDAESLVEMQDDVLDELQHGARIDLDENDHANYAGGNSMDDCSSTLSLSRAPEIVLHEGEEQSVDLSSVGMESAAGAGRTPWLDEQQPSAVSIPLQLRKSSRQRLYYSWTPSSARGRSRRWNSHPAFAQVGNNSAAMMRQTTVVPAVLQEEHLETSVDLEAPPPLTAQGDDDESSVSHSVFAKSTSQSAVLDEASSDTKTNDSNTSSRHNHGGAPPLSIASPYTLMGAPDSKFECYYCVVDSSQEDRAVEIQLGSMARPHMRAFHLAWMAFFVAFFTWFALTPLLSEIAISLDLNKQEIWTSSILGVAGSAVTRILIGPICDKYGARWAMGGTLFLSGIPMALTGLVQTGIGLSILRLFIGLAGSAFVTSQYWSSSMFTREVAGTANAIVAGWGNLGGGVTQLVMGSLVFPLLKIVYGGEGWTRAETVGDGDADTEYDRASDLAWRTSCVVPASMCFAMTYFVIRRSDDCPKGNYYKRNREGFMPSVSAQKSIIAGLRNFTTWILFIQYGCCFGVEITMVNAAALYFKEEFGLSTEVSAAVASIFGWMNLFARGLGGFLSDILNAKLGMRGRLWCQIVTLLTEGALVIVFSKTVTLGGAIVVMIAFSIFVQAAEGSTYGIVPYVNPEVTGSISGIVGSGGNVGGVVFATIFRQLQYRNAFSAMGLAAVVSALLTIPLRIPGHASLFCGSDNPEVRQLRTNYMEEMGTIPPVGLDPDSNRRTSVLDRDTSRRTSTAEVDRDTSGRPRQEPMDSTDDASR